MSDGPTTWRRQIEQLANDFTVIAWDARGAGESSDPLETIAIAGSKLVVVPDAGHLCNVEAADEFNEAVRRFLREQRH